MSQRFYTWILKGGVYASFLIVFAVFSSLLFPFITSKQITFNMLIEVLMIFWVGLIVKYPAYRPQKSWITASVGAFLAAIFISSLTGVDFNLSFWGDIERMLGVFHVLHFFALYLILVAVMRSWSDWRNLLMVSVIAALIESFYVIYKINYGTIGNTAYVSGFMIFNIYFALLLFFRQKNWGLRSFYLIAMAFMLYAMRTAGTRGAYVGLAASIVLAAFLVAMLNSSKKIKIASIAAVGIFVVLVGLVFANAKSDFVQKSSLLRRISEIDTKSATFQTRLISWRGAAKDFKSHPILGTGFGNYAVTFDKFFDPTFFNYSRSESYFDRAHNNLIDIVTTSGLVGLITYLSIFVAAGYYLITGFRSGKISKTEFVLLTSLLVAYFIQNLAVFDSYVTYIGLMITLGYIYWLNSEENKVDQDEVWTNKEFYAILGAGLVLLFIFYQYNYKVVLMLQATIDGQFYAAKGDIKSAVNAYRRAAAFNTVLNRDSDASLGQLSLSQGNAIYQLDKASANKIMEFVIERQKKNVAYNQKDSFMQMTLGQTLNLAAGINNDNQEKFSYYSSQAEAAIDKAIEASPRRVPLYFLRSQILLTRGEKDKAIEQVKYSISMNPEYSDGYCQLARIYSYYKDDKAAMDNMNKCIDLNGYDQIGGPQQVKELIGFYNQKKDYDRLVKLYVILTTYSEPGDAKNWAGMASAYLQVGKKTEAIAAAEKAKELDPTFAKSADEFINKVKNSK